MVSLQNLKFLHSLLFDSYNAFKARRLEDRVFGDKTAPLGMGQHMASAAEAGQY